MFLGDCGSEPARCFLEALSPHKRAHRHSIRVQRLQSTQMAPLGSHPRIFEKELFPLSRFVGFAEIDWVYCLTRSLRRCDHRVAEARRALAAFAERHIAFLTSLDPETDDGLDDLHSLFGTICALAELQSVLGDRLRSDRPLRLVLDRRPFI